MAQGGIRKGFFFYFGLFVLLLIAIFLIILVVLLFNPGKTILWMQYFTANDTYQITKTTDESETPIDFTTLKRIEVDCSIADVTIQRHENINKDCIQIVNNAKGFATSSQARQFKYDVLLNDGVLTIDVIEPVGFLYLSDDISITINIAYKINNGVVTTSGNYSNIDFQINTTSGNVFLGSTTPGSHTVSPKSITAETSSGNIYVNTNTEIAGATSVSFSTDNGSMIATGLNGISLNSGNIRLKTNKGSIEYDTVKTSGEGKISIINDKGSVVINNLTASNIEVNCYEGNYKIGKVQGNLSFTPSEDKLMSPNVRITEINGDFSMSSSNDANPDVIIGKLNGKANIAGISGWVQIDEMNGLVNATMKDGNLHVNFVDNATYAEDTIQTENANVIIGFKGALNHIMNITSNKGKITFNVTNKGVFTSTAYQKDNQSQYLSDDKITVNIGYEGTKNPLIINQESSSRATITIYTNSNVEYNLKDAV